MQINQSKLNYEGLSVSVENDVSFAHERALMVHNSLLSYPKTILESTDQLQKSMFQNYQKHNVTLVEFVDFYESFTINTIAFLDLQLEREKALEELNFVVGKKISQ